MIDKLLDAAFRAATKAYAPYSGFKVGAALELSNGEIITGCNIENSSYGLTMCAERVAIYKAVSDLDKPNSLKIVRIAVVGGGDNRAQFISPCGACREVISEFARNQNADIEIVMSNNTEIITSKISQLLPFSFELEQIKK